MKRFLIISLLALSAASLYAQNKGYLTGSFETNDHFYVKDQANSFSPMGDKFGSNNYLKVDYYNNRFSAGLQLEAYAPALIGYPAELSKYALSNLYVNWSIVDEIILCLISCRRT
mgnify:CR=1 FL=1